MLWEWVVGEGEEEGGDGGDEGVRPREAQALLLGVTRSSYIFHKIELVMLTGKAVRLHQE